MKCPIFNIFFQVKWLKLALNLFYLQKICRFLQKILYLSFALADSAKLIENLTKIAENYNVMLSSSANAEMSYLMMC